MAATYADDVGPLVPDPPLDDAEVVPDPPPDEDESAAPAGVVDVALVPIGRAPEVLPADFVLPIDVRFIASPVLRERADADAALLLAIDAQDAATMQQLDAALARQREHKRVILDHFAEAKSEANKRHKRITGLESLYLEKTEQALETGGKRLANCDRKLRYEAEERRRAKQAEADARERDRARQQAAEAARTNAPPEVIEQLEFEAETATAPPVTPQEPAVSAPLSTSITRPYKSRLVGTPGDAEDQQPKMADLTPMQRIAVITAMKACIEGRAPLTVFEIGYSYTDKRAKADKSAFAIPGFEVFEDSGTRAKPARRV